MMARTVRQSDLVQPGHLRKAKRCSRIVALEHRVAVLRVLVEQLDEERATSAALRYLIAPVRTLPAELLAEIFLLTFQNNPPDLDHVRPLHFQDVFRVSHVLLGMETSCDEHPAVVDRVYRAGLLVQEVGEGGEGYRLLCEWVESLVGTLRTVLHSRCPLGWRIGSPYNGRSAEGFLPMEVSTAPRATLANVQRLCGGSLSRSDGSGEARGLKASDFDPAPSFPRLRKLFAQAQPTLPIPWSPLKELHLEQTRPNFPSTSFPLLGSCHSIHYESGLAHSSQAQISSRYSTCAPCVFRSFASAMVRKPGPSSVSPLTAAVRVANDAFLG
ncbi:hypothetical protein B0H13DRAFT_1034421 [Mycena leptocephala]|nr:hypothetical protein B0H13DRAFT_1034421 [Mycena leptocephala]